LPYRAFVNVIADDDFELWINGINAITNADYGTSNDLGPDFVHTVDVTPLIQPGGINLIALHATDGNLFAPTDVLFEHALLRLRIETVPEPSSLALALIAALVFLACRHKRSR
jgi:hypothetical protein